MQPAFADGKRSFYFLRPTSICKCHHDDHWIAWEACLLLWKFGDRSQKQSLANAGVHSGLNVMCADDSEIVPRQRLSKDLKNMLRHDRGAERYERARYALQAIGGFTLSHK
eukprot:2071864-Amphidinium_carterae.1